MNFMMNGRIFKIETATENELWGDVGEQNKKDSNYFGRFRPFDQKILLNELLTKEQTKYTLIHELTHCYIWCFMSKFDSFDEEDICNIHMNSHDIINKIVNDYFEEASL